MENIYRLLDWLNVAQAVDWLQDMTHKQVDETLLLQLCGAGQCSVYLNCERYTVHLETGEDWPPYCEAIGLGMSKVQNPIQFIDNSSAIDLVGSAVVKSTMARIEDCNFSLSPSVNSPQPRFKPSDIEALGAKMNGRDEKPETTELVTLRQQLERERIKCEAAVSEIEELQNSLRTQLEITETAQANVGFLHQDSRDDAAKIEALRIQLDKEKYQVFSAEHYKNEALGRERHVRLQLDQVTASRFDDAQALKALRLQLGHERVARETAEAEVLRLRQELDDEYNSRQAAEDDAGRDAAYRHDDLLRGPPSWERETPTAGLTFPYATRELEAMRAAALKYWANHTPDKRQPTQVEIQLELCELLGLPLMNDKSPTRKAVELAAAIKPSTMPDV